MNKLKNKSGMTLMEMMVSILILVLLVVAMGTGMNSGMRIYEDAIFESNSASLSSIVNTTLSDLLRYSELTQSSAAAESGQIYVTNSGGERFLVTNLDYGIKNACFTLDTVDSIGVLRMKNTQNGAVVDLINTGSSPNLSISAFQITYVDSQYFQIEYTITSKINAEKIREVAFVVRLLNT